MHPHQAQINRSLDPRVFLNIIDDIFDSYTIFIVIRFVAMKTLCVSRAQADGMLPQACGVYVKTCVLITWWFL